MYIYQQGASKPIEAEVAASGAWNSRIQAQSGSDYVYGYAANPRSPSVRKCFRVNIFSRKHEPVIADEFDRLRSQEP